MASRIFKFKPEVEENITITHPDLQYNEETGEYDCQKLSNAAYDYQKFVFCMRYGEKVSRAKKTVKNEKK